MNYLEKKQRKKIVASTLSSDDCFKVSDLFHMNYSFKTQTDGWVKRKKVHAESLC